RDFVGIPFLQINGNFTTIHGLSFTKMLYNSNNDHILQIGTAVKDATDTRISSNSFFEDNFIVAGINKKSIDIVNASNLLFDSNSFGIDLSKNIYSTEGSIRIESTQGVKPFNLVNNIFLTKVDAIDARGGNGLISKNLFGALDTLKALNFLDPLNAILLSGGNGYKVDSNYFFNLNDKSVFATDLTGLTEITNNRFYNGVLTDIEIAGNSAATIGIRKNYARNGSTFVRVNASGAYSFNLDNNDVSQYDNFYINILDPAINLASYNNNTMFCIANQVVSLDNTKSPKPNTPTIISVNKNQIIGSADPNMFVAVYANPNTNCIKANTNCQGGFLLGVSQANALGSWVLNVNYPNKHSLSAYQYKLGTGYNIYSEFSPCYRCLAPKKDIINPALCANSSITFRGKNYGAANPNDSIFIAGDGVSICDSIFIIDLQIKNAVRDVRNINYCYNQSITIGGKTINKNNPIDSIQDKTTVGCDSTIVLIGTERGYSIFQSTICSNSSVTVGGVTFDKNNPKGTATISNGSVFGCDSTIDVDLTIKNFAENNIITTLCPNGSITVGNEIFDKNKPKGSHKFPLGSATGCDSIVNVDLTFSNPVSSKSFDVCVGDSVFVPGVIVGTGKYISSRKPLDTLVLIGGSYLKCDSLVFISVRNIPNSMGIFNLTICRKDTVDVLGDKFHAGRTMGSVVKINGASNGCDSTIQVVLSIRPDAIGSFDTFACAGSTVNIYGTLFDESKPSGNLKAPFSSSFGCDTFIMVNVTFIKEKTVAVNPVICRNSTINIGGTIFSESNPRGMVRISRSAAQGCDSIIDVTVSIAPPIITDFSKEDLKCNVANSGSVTINNINAGGGTNITVSIDKKTPVPYSANQSFNNLSEGIHNIKVTDANGCDTTFNFSVDASQTLTLSLPADTTIFQGASVILNSIQNFVPSKITWDPFVFLSCPDCLNPTSTPDGDVTYMLILEDANGCIVKDDITIRVKVNEADIFVPNVFSPNSDGVNDAVIPEFKFLDKTKINIYRVFDRWGALVYERLNGALGEKFGWDGRFKGQDLMPGVYTYIIQYQALNQEAKWKLGDVTLMR
ncbi:MAG: gliding motility-associated C-terminal domain-containing protein, partial [Saprospiraceae bacterium]